MPGDEDDEVKTPAGWGKAKGVKGWSAGARADDPDKRVVLLPTGQGLGSGQAFLFHFGLKRHAPGDRRLFDLARGHIDDDVDVLRAAGYTVVIDEEATHADFLASIYGTGEGVDGLSPAGVFWLAHGHADGAIETVDGGVVAPGDVDASRVHPGLKLVVFAACYTGSCSRSWRRALGGRPLVVGWGRPVTIDRAVEFLTPDDATENDLDDLIRRYLLSDVPVPAEVEVRWSPLAPAAQAGREADLRTRLEGTLAVLRAKVRPVADGDEGAALEADVPLPDGRWHRAKLFVLDSNEPFCEGETLLGVECDVGELSAVVDASMLLAGIPESRFARVQLVDGGREMPNIVVQGFTPLARVSDGEAAALAYSVCRYADVLERRIFGGDAR